MRIAVMKYFLIFSISIGFSMQGITLEKLKQLLNVKSHFGYDLGIKIFPGKSAQESIMICCHGYGANNQIGDCVHSAGVVKEHIVSFNFPDYDLHARSYDPKKSTFGSSAELLPLFYLLKKCVIDGQQEKISLYGFSAGGAAVINTLAVLNQGQYDQALKELGIDAEGKAKIRAALERGIIILDCPLKSIEELMAARGKTLEFEILAKRYAQNKMRSIDAVNELKGLHLNILLYFENPDEILSNRDDHLFMDRLARANAGKTEIVIGCFGGHTSYHRSLWERYKKIS